MIKSSSQLDNKGYRTTEFWVSIVAAVLSAVLASEHGDTIQGLVVVLAPVLAALGYTASRTVVKRERIRKES